MKLSSVEDGVGTDSKDVKWTDTTNKLQTDCHTRSHTTCTKQTQLAACSV
jgi:hypothetical protein